MPAARLRADPARRHLPNSFNSAIIYPVVGTAVLALYPFIQRYFVRGLMIGSLKG